MNLSVYTLDEDKFIRAYNKLNSESYQVENFSDTKFTGTLTASSDKAILFSIPYDGGWSVYIEGKKADTYAWENALLCVDVSAGTHTVVLKYRPVNLILGCVITTLCIIILIGIYLASCFIKAEKVNMAHFPLVIRKYLDDPSLTNKDIKKLSDDNIESSILDDMDDFENLESPDIDDELTDSLLSSIEDEEDNFNEENTDI